MQTTQNSQLVTYYYFTTLLPHSFSLVPPGDSDQRLWLLCYDSCPGCFVSHGRAHWTRIQCHQPALIVGATFRRRVSAGFNRSQKQRPVLLFDLLFSWTTGQRSGRTSLLCSLATQIPLVEMHVLLLRTSLLVLVYLVLLHLLCCDEFLFCFR